MSKHISLYNNKEWYRIRTKRLRDEPFCRMCDTQLHIKTKSDTVDHIIPHRGVGALFFDYANTQSLCKRHHDSVKQTDEKRAYSKLVGDDGWPIDDKHPIGRTQINGGG